MVSRFSRLSPYRRRPRNRLWVVTAQHAGFRQHGVPAESAALASGRVAYFWRHNPRFIGGALAKFDRDGPEESAGRMFASPFGGVHFLFGARSWRKNCAVSSDQELSFPSSAGISRGRE